jgi:ribosomal protein S27AE
MAIPTGRTRRVIHAPKAYKLRSSREATYSGCRLRCGRCRIVKLTVAEYRKQLTDRADQLWHCPKCGSVAELRR